MSEDTPSDRAVLLKNAGTIGLLLLLLAVLFGFRFTHRTHEDKERARARILLQTLYRVEEAYHAEHGTYLPIDRERNIQYLKLDDHPGALRFQVQATRNTFVATVQADPSGDGTIETWQIDNRHPQPVLVPNRRIGPGALPTQP